MSQPKSPKSQRLEELSRKFEIMKSIPSRITADIEFSEDEDEEGYCTAPTKVIGVPHRPNSNLARSNLVTPGIKDGKDSRKNTPADTNSNPSIEYDQLYANTMEKIARLNSRSKARRSNQLSKSNEEMPNILSVVPDKKISPAPTDSPRRNNEEQSLKVNGKTYTVLSLLGSGGSCKVYSVFDKDSKKILAIKCVNLGKADKAIAEGFRKEINFLKLFQTSDYVIKMLDHEFQNEKLLILLEKGEIDLAHYLSDEKKKQNLTPITIKHYWYQMLKAVAAIHESGIVHSDLKPANFLLVSGNLKLIDFGIAISVPEDQTSVLRACQIGTMNYMSPESFSCHPSSANANYVFKVGKKADVWSLGCMLYNMVYGHTPFDNISGVSNKIQAIVNPLHEIPFPELEDRHLLDVLKSCLVRDCGKRASVEELLAHPYLKQCSGAVSSKAEINKLVGKLETLTPRRMSAVTKVIHEISKKNNSLK